MENVRRTITAGASDASLRSLFLLPPVPPLPPPTLLDAPGTRLEAHLDYLDGVGGRRKRKRKVGKHIFHIYRYLS